MAHLGAADDYDELISLLEDGLDSVQVAEVEGLKPSDEEGSRQV
jgi:hypothetical protein